MSDRTDGLPYRPPSETSVFFSPPTTDPTTSTTDVKINALPTPPIPPSPTPSSHTPSSSTPHTYTHNTVKQDLTIVMNKKKNEQDDRIKEQEKQCETRLKTQMVWGAVIALTVIGVVAAIAAASILGGPIGGLVVAGVGLVSGAIIVSWATHKFMEASDFANEADVRASKARLTIIEEALNLFETTKADAYSFQDFINEFDLSTNEVSDFKEYMSLYKEKLTIRGFEKNRAALENEIERLDEEIKNSDEKEKKQAQLTQKAQEIAELKKNQELYQKDFTKRLENFNSKEEKKTDAKKDEKAKQTEPPSFVKVWLNKPPALDANRLLPVKQWALDLSPPRKTRPLYMLGNTLDPPKELSAEEITSLATHGFNKEHAFLSSSDTSQTLYIDKKPYNSPLHYVLQKMLEEIDQEAAESVAREVSSKNALEAAKKYLNSKENTSYEVKSFFVTNYEIAGKHLKRALFVKFANEDGTPNALGIKLMKTTGKELIATNELGFEEWGWGARMSEDKTEISGSNLLGTYLTELRDWFLQQEAGIGAKPTPPPPHYKPPTLEEEKERIKRGAPEFPTTAPPPLPSLESPTTTPPTTPTPTTSKNVTVEELPEDTQ